MINLISTSDKIQLTPSSTSALEVRVDFVEATTASSVIQADTFVPGNQRTAFSAATVADILTAPATNRCRNVKLIVVKNSGATNPATNTVLCEVVNAAGNCDLFNVPLAVGEWLTWNETGVLFVYAIDGSVKSAGQSVAFISSTGFAGPVTGYASDTYLAGSRILLPTSALVGGQTSVRWAFGISKTAAGTAAPTVIIRYGTAGAISDTARVTFTFAAQTAVIDRGWMDIIATFRSVGSGTSAILDCEAALWHQLATTGLNVTTQGGQELAVSSSGFDSTPAGSYIGLSVNAGASAAWTITSVLGFATI